MAYLWCLPATLTVCLPFFELNPHKFSRRIQNTSLPSPNLLDAYFKPHPSCFTFFQRFPNFYPSKKRILKHAHFVPLL